MIDDNLIRKFAKTPPPHPRGGNTPKIPNIQPSKKTNIVTNQPQKTSQSKIAIKNMQTSMLAFSSAFTTLAVGSNVSGRRSTGENLDPSNKAKADKIKKELESEEAKLKNLGDENKLVQLTNFKSPQAKSQERILELRKQLEFANNNASQTKDVHGLRPIGQILLNDYIGKNTLQGMTLTDVDMHKPDRVEQGTGAQDNVSFMGVINSIGRVGTPADRQKTKQELDLEKQISQLNDKITKESRTPQAINSAKVQLAKEYTQSKGSTVIPQNIPDNEAEARSLQIVKNKYNTQSVKLNQNLSQATRFALQDQKDNPGEEKEDGIWDVRTNNSLKNIAGIMQGVLSFTSDMKININSYSQKYMDQFKKGVPDDPELLRIKFKKENKDYDTSVSSLADALTSHIKAQIRYLDEFRKQLFSNPQYDSYINQEKSLYEFDKSDPEAINKKHSEQRKAQESKDENLTYENSNLNSMDQGSQEYYKRFYNHFDSNYHGAGIQVAVNGKQFIVKYNDLSSLTSFENLYKRINGKEPDTKEDLVNLFNQVNSTISKFKDGAQYVAPDEPLTQSVPYRVKVPSKLPWDRTETRFGKN